MKSFFTLFFLIGLTGVAVAQQDESIKRTYSIDWRSNVVLNGEDRLNFTNCFYKQDSKMPYFSTGLPLADITKVAEVSIENPVYEPLISNNTIDASSEILPETKLSYFKGKPSLYIEFVPVRKNAVTGQTEKLVAFNLKVTSGQQSQKIGAVSTQVYAANSVLASGEWYKISVTEDGVYKITYSFLKDHLKIDLSASSPQSFRLFGNGGGILPLLNSQFRYDDLQENAVFVNDGGTAGKWDDQDYVLFYGQSPVQWYYNSSQNRYYHQANYYSDSTFYFISLGLPLVS
mgnify:FL=1